MADGDIPMSDEVQQALITREARFAVEDFEKDLRAGMTSIAELMVKFQEDPDENGLSTMLLVALSLEGIRASVVRAVENFRKRTET